MTIPFTIQGTFDAMKALLEQAGVTAPMFLGARHLLEHGAPPRIVWVPTQDTIGAPLYIGTHPVRLFDSQLGIAVHCWGETFDEAIALRDAFVRASRLLQGAAFEITGGGFYNPNDDGWIKLGEVYALSCSVPLPIFEEPLSDAKTARIERFVEET